MLSSNVCSHSIEDLLHQIRRGLQKTYSNNANDHAVKYASTIAILQPLMDQYMENLSDHSLGLKHRKLLSEAFNDLAVSLAEKAWLESMPSLQLRARSYYLHSLRQHPTALTARNLGRLLESLEEWMELKGLMDWCLEKFTDSHYRSELLGMLKRATRKLR